jgi:hypothetical protein
MESWPWDRLRNNLAVQFEVSVFSTEMACCAITPSSIMGPQKTKREMLMVGIGRFGGLCVAGRDFKKV